MRFFLDENFPKSAIPYLEELGHSVFDPRGTELQGRDDAELLKEAIDGGAILLTTDRDFYHTIRHEHSEHPGIVSLPSGSPIARRFSPGYNGC